MEKKEVVELWGGGAWKTFLAGLPCTIPLHSFSEPKAIMPHRAAQFQSEAYKCSNKKGGLMISRLKVLL